MGETYFEMTSRERATEGPLVIEIEGLEELSKALADFADGWEEIASEALIPGMATISSAAKQIVRVDTGRLMSSIGEATPGPPAKAGDGIMEIKRVGSEIIGKVGSNVEYASYQEYGTKYQSGKPYMRPALERNVEKVRKVFEEGIVKALRKLRLMD